MSGLLELMRLRVQDLDLKRNQVVVRCGKGGKDRVAPLSEKLVADIEHNRSPQTKRHLFCLISFTRADCHLKIPVQPP